MLPMLATSDKSVENLILNTVKDNPDVSAKRVYNSITKAGITVTYHKVFEKMQDMVKKGIMVKNDRLYSVSNVWVERTFNFMVRMDNKKILKENPYFEQVSNMTNAKVLSFNSLEMFLEFLNGVRGKFIDNCRGDNNEILWLGNHVFGPFMYTKTRISNLNKINKNKIGYYIAIRGNSLLDKKMLKFYNDQGIKTAKINVNDSSKNTIYIYNDTVFYVIRSVELMDKMDSICDNMKSLEDFNEKTKLCKLIQEENPFHVIMMKDEKLADYYKNRIKFLFR
jgi:hypothetical protein